MSEVKNEGLEVGGVRAIVTDAFVSMIEAALGMKAPDCAPPAFIQSAIDRAIDRINSEALSGYAVRDTRIAELEGMVICCGVAATNADPFLTATGAYAEKWASQQSSDVLALRLERDQLRAELADAKETITRYEVTAENCDVLRAELAAIKARGVTDFVFSGELPNATFVEVEDGNGNSINVGEWFKRDDGYSVLRLYAAPVAKQDNEDLKRAWQAGHDTAWYGKNPAHERGSVPVDKQVVMQSTNFTASNGEQRNPRYQGQFEGETRDQAAYRLHWVTAAIESERLNAADQEGGV